MLRYYETPKLHVTVFDMEDIVLTSDGKISTSNAEGKTEKDYNDWIQGGEW